MIPNHYACTACQEIFKFASRDAVYYVNGGAEPLANRVAGRDLIHVPVRPGWCKDCGGVCLVEDIASLRAFENAYGAVRAGGRVEYPVESTGMSAQEAELSLAAYLRWRMGRRHVARALCCGRSNFQLLDVAQPLLKHQECEFGFVEPRIILSGYNGPGPGIYSAADIPVYSGEGELMGRLTWRERSSDTWAVVPAAYSKLAET